MAKSGYVYAIHIQGEDLVKIGCSSDPDNRLEILNSSIKNCQLVLSHVSCLHPQKYALEKAYHAYFIAYQIIGEWYAIPRNRLAHVFELGIVDDQVSIEEQKPKTRSVLSNRLYMLRRRKGIKPGQLAEKANIPVTAITHLERGKIEDLAGSRVIRLAKFFEVSTDFLLGHSDDEKNIPLDGETIGDRVKYMLWLRDRSQRNLAQAIEIAPNHVRNPYLKGRGLGEDTLRA